MKLYDANESANLDPLSTCLFFAMCTMFVYCKTLNFILATGYWAYGLSHISGGLQTI